MALTVTLIDRVLQRIGKIQEERIRRAEQGRIPLPCHPYPPDIEVPVTHKFVSAD